MVRHRPSRLICRIDVTGFLAIMLFLYFLFAIPFGMVPRDLGPFVDMPKANHSISLPGARRDDALIITVLFDALFLSVLSI